MSAITGRSSEAGGRRGRRLRLHGVVQGVGLRPWVWRLATAIGLDGRVSNDILGVTVEAFGTTAQLDELCARARAEAPAPASVEEIATCDIPADETRGFHIVPSTSRAGEVTVSIPPDLATCADCLREILDPGDRRHRYPFTNCTHCGPRFTIARDVPYDRPATTMAAFTMCPECAREYETPSDRRFHAQPNACPLCGPRLSVLDEEGAAIPAADPLQVGANLIAAGFIVAVKGLGGYHLACDATSSRAVARLRARKQREEKPLAVMVTDLDAAGRLAFLSDEDKALLSGASRPIVILRRRPEAALAPEVSMGSPSVGLMLAYTPLHHLLLREAGLPLVMTSGNLRDEPIAVTEIEATTRLAGIADGFLVHDRAIDARADDSVARIIAGAPALLRRARGYVPGGIAVTRPLAWPVLAVGAHLKNTFALGSGGVVTLGPHVGDLESVEAYSALETMVARMERFLGCRPEVVACDLHPGYLSTRYARERARALDAPLVEVQHHHAHVASAMAEHGLTGPVLGLAWDGTGLGSDGTAWGGELLLATYAGFQRLATFRPLRLAGGDRAVREPWRTALALVDDAFDGDAPLRDIPVLAGRPHGEVTLVRRMIAASLNAPSAHGVGRYFDAVAALALDRPFCSHEGQLPAALEWAAEPGPGRAYPFTVDFSVEPWQVDLRPLARAAVDDLVARRGVALIAARFHEALAAVAAALVAEAARRHGDLPVVLGGGCFHNARLVEAVLRRLAETDARVYTQRRVPCGDGGLALGQVLIADAVRRGEGR